MRGQLPTHTSDERIIWPLQSDLDGKVKQDRGPWNYLNRGHIFYQLIFEMIETNPHDPHIARSHIGGPTLALVPTLNGGPNKARNDPFRNLSDLCTSQGLCASSLMNRGITSFQVTLRQQYYLEIVKEEMVSNTRHCGRFSHLGHLWHFVPGGSLLWGDGLCPVGYQTASVASTLQLRRPRYGRSQLPSSTPSIFYSLIQQTSEHSIRPGIQPSTRQVKINKPLLSKAGVREGNRESITIQLPMSDCLCLAAFFPLPYQQNLWTKETGSMECHLTG